MACMDRGGATAYDDHPNAHGMSPELSGYVRRAWEAGG